jgi:sarcosine oxidase
VLELAAMPTFDVAIVGAGVMGAASACELALEGAKIALIDQSLLPNPSAASVDHSKVFRFAYPDPLYVKLAVDALDRWRQLEAETATRLLTPTGALLIGRRRPSIEMEYYEALCAEGLDAELLDSRQVAARFPQFDSSAFAYGVYDPSGAVLHAETAVHALIDLARQRSVEVIEEEEVFEIKQAAAHRVSVVTGSGREVVCRRAMIASGPWSRKLLPFLRDKLTTTRQELVYFEPTSETNSPGATGMSGFEPGSFPIFLELESGFYGFPIHHGGAMKIANHHKGSEVDPSSTDDRVGEQFIERCRKFFGEFIPGLANARVCETKLCCYNNTPDDDFIIDWDPQRDGVLVVTGFSGHGFKFGPTVGRIAADLLLSGRTPFDIDRFRLTRFNNK